MSAAATSRISKNLLSMEEFKSEAPVCSSTVENWVRRHPERLPKMVKIGIRRFFDRAEAEQWLRDNFAAGWEQD